MLVPVTTASRRPGIATVAIRTRPRRRAGSPSRGAAGSPVGPGPASRRRRSATARSRAGPNGGTSAPASVTIAEMRPAGVTSKAGFQATRTGRRDPGPGELEDLAGGPLLDRDPGPVHRREVDRVERRTHVERDAVVGGQDRQRVRPDLVGRVAVRGDPVRPDEDGVDRSAGEHRPGRRVGREGVGHAGLLELPGGETGALQVRSGLVDVDVDLAAGVDGRLDDPECGPELAAGERAGVAVGEDPDRAIERPGQQREPVLGEESVISGRLGADRVGLGPERSGDDRAVLGGRVDDLEPGQHPVHRPAEVHRGRPGEPQGVRRRPGSSRSGHRA